MTVLNRIKEFLDARPDSISGTESTSAYRFWQETGIGRDTAYRMYNDPTYIPTSRVLNKICNTYKIQPGRFLVWEPDDEQQTAVVEFEKFGEPEQQIKGIDIDTKSPERDRTGSIVTVILEVPETA